MRSRGIDEWGPHLVILLETRYGFPLSSFLLLIKTFPEDRRPNTYARINTQLDMTGGPEAAHLRYVL